MDGNLKNMAKKAIPANKGALAPLPTGYLATYNYRTEDVNVRSGDDESETFMVEEFREESPSGEEFLTGRVRVRTQNHPCEELILQGTTGEQAVKLFALMLNMRDEEEYR